MQRYRYQRIRLGEKLASGEREPASHHGGELEPVAIFECMHQGAGNFVEAHPARAR